MHSLQTVECTASSLHLILHLPLFVSSSVSSGVSRVRELRNEEEAPICSTSCTYLAVTLTALSPDRERICTDECRSML